MVDRPRRWECAPDHLASPTVSSPYRPSCFTSYARKICTSDGTKNKLAYTPSERFLIQNTGLSLEDDKRSDTRQTTSIALEHGMDYVFFKPQILTFGTPRLESQAPLLCMHDTMPSSFR